MKKTKQKSKVKPKSKKKPKILAVASAPEFYTVDVEVASKAGDNTTSYKFVSIPTFIGVEESVAQSKADEMKMIGVGGRIVHLDGTPEGKVVAVWGSVERATAAEKIEQQAIDNRAGHN